MVIKSDNGTAFRNELMAHFAKYAGFPECLRSTLQRSGERNGRAECRTHHTTSGETYAGVCQLASYFAHGH
eukprot:2623725-Pleurochrysis_carterae.AAC.1